MKDSPPLQVIAELLATAQHVVVLANLNGKVFVVSNKLGHIEDLTLCVKAQTAIETKLKESQN